MFPPGPGGTALPQGEDRIPTEAELIDRVNWLIRLRWLAVLGAGSVVALGWFLYPGQLPLVPLIAVILVIALYNGQFFFYARTLKLARPGTSRLQQATRFASVQILLDILALAALVHFSGGVESPVAVFFVFHIIIASMLLSRWASLLVATLAIVVYAAIAGFEYAGLLPHHHSPMMAGIELKHSLPFLLSAVGAIAITLWIVVFIVSSISLKLRERERELLESQRYSLAKTRELEMLNLRLQRLDAERTRFMTLVTHELRAPINTIHTCVELALAGYASPEKVRDILERVQRRTEELSELISDLLRLARAREEASRDEPVALVQPAEVLGSVVQLMRAEAERKDLFLSVDIAPDLAPVRAHPDRLKLVWTNLLSNAIKYTELGGIVAVTLNQTSENLVGTVRDTGIGIPAHDLERIFEEFYRAENAKEVSRVGTGVGLAIVQRIIGNWGGSISVESELGLGSKFTFVLPRADL